MIPADSAFSPLVAQLRQQHQDLARRCLSAQVGADERQAFIDELIASGKVLASGRDRDAVRKLLFYWTADAVSRGERSREEPLPSLQPFDGEKADAGSAVRRALTMAQSSEDIEATTADTRAAIRIATLARQWMSDNRGAGYLLTGEALQEAARLADKDPDIRTLVDASTAAETVRAAAEAERTAAELYKAKRAKMVFIGFIAGAILVLILSITGIYLWRVTKELQTTRLQLETTTARLADFDKKNQEEARSALDALRWGRDDPLEPLKKLLKRLGDAQPEELDRLQYRPPAGPASAAQGDKIDRDPRVPTLRPVATDLGVCKGVLWLGSDAAKLIEYQGALKDLKAGATITVNDGVNIRLREKMPAANYVMTPQIGLIPGGATLKLTGVPERHTRAGVDQYFAPVDAPRQYCVRVFIQYVGDDDQVDDLRARLRPLGVQVPAAQEVRKAPADAEVRVFTKDDRGVANLVADQLKPFNGGRKLAVVELYNFPTRPAPGTIEVWITLKR